MCDAQIDMRYYWDDAKTRLIAMPVSELPEQLTYTVYTDPYICLSTELAKLIMAKAGAVKTLKQAEQVVIQYTTKIRTIQKVLDESVWKDDNIIGLNKQGVN